MAWLYKHDRGLRLPYGKRTGVEAVDRLTIRGRGVDLIEEPDCCEEVDCSLIPFVLSHGIHATAVNGQVDGRVAEHLRGAEVPCTVIRSPETSI